MLESMIEETNTQLFNRRLSSEVESKARRRSLQINISTPLSRSRTMERAESKQDDYLEAEENSESRKKPIKNHRPLLNESGSYSEFSSTLSAEEEIKVFKESDEFDLIVRQNKI